MRIRWVAWGVMMTLHFLVLGLAPETLAPALAGSVYLPLMPLRALGLPVLSSAQSGGWAGPSVLGWAVVVLVWAAIWWGVASLVARVTRPGHRVSSSA